MRDIPIYMVFVLYLIISSNFMAQLFPCRLQHMLNQSMLAKHIVGYMTLLFFVVLSSGDKYSTSRTLLYSLMIYITFWWSTRVAFNYLMMFLILSATLYIIQLYEKEIGIQTSKRLETVKNVVSIVMLVVLLVGFVVYVVEKKLEYKNKFSLGTFILGKPECRNKSPTLSRSKLFQLFKKNNKKNKIKLKTKKS